ncbi:MAG TPA: translation initiation factor IF-3 [Opitutaceae bacterium]|jgi:translation initiation factor IF-3|nr:translation initiation factor IF-3 [Opitutaceae bacterium]
MANSFPSSGGGRPGQYQRRNTDPFANIRRNHRIKVPQVRVISPEGKQLGILPTEKAIALAMQVGLDLVEFAPAAQPPVCRIIDFGKYVYEEQKKHSHVKSTASRIKEIEFTARIEQHDFLTKLRHAEEFLDHGNKVKLRLKFRGREMAHTEIGFEVIKRATTELAGMGHPDNEPKLLGKQINVMLTPLPANKRKPKFHVPEDDEDEAEPPAPHSGA